MPLSDHEQRMLDQIESALYAEDPKFASSVRGGTLRAPSARRRIYGAGLFVLGLAMLVTGVAVKALMIGGFPILSVIGFIVMFGGVVFAITGPRVAGGVDKSSARPVRHDSASSAAVGRSPTAWKTVSAGASTTDRQGANGSGVVREGCPFFMPSMASGSARPSMVNVPDSPHLSPRVAPPGPTRP